MIKTLQTLLEQGTQTGFTTVEAFGESLEKHEYECFPEEAPGLHTLETQRVTVRAFWDSGDPVGFSLSKPNPNSIKSAFSRIYSSQLPEEKKNFAAHLPSAAKKTKIPIFDESFAAVEIHAFNEFIDRVNEIMVSSPFQGLKLRKLHLAKSLKKTYIANSNGLNAKYRKTNFHMVLSFSLGENHMETRENRVFFHQFEPYKMISRAFNLLGSLSGAGVCAGRQLSLILSPEASAFILREFSPSFKLNTAHPKEILEIHYPSILNVIDNPTLEDQVGSAPFDDEGVQSEEKYLIRRGVLTTIVSDISTAFRHHSASTGNGFRSERSLLPVIGFSNLYIKPTVLPLRNLMNDAGQGVLVSLLKLKAIDKDGSLFSAYGYRFNEGELREPVHFYLKTTFRSYFLKILKVSKEIKFFYSSANIGSPYILLEARRKSDQLFEI
jgi:predicted Zn-dependent protease